MVLWGVAAFYERLFCEGGRRPPFPARLFFLKQKELIKLT